MEKDRRGACAGPVDDPDNNRGVALRKKDDLDAAIMKYLRAIELDPENADAHFNKALALQI